MYIQVSFDMLCVYSQNSASAVIHVIFTCCTHVTAICALSTRASRVGLLHRFLLRIHRSLLTCFACFCRIVLLSMSYSHIVLTLRLYARFPHVRLEIGLLYRFLLRVNRSLLRLHRSLLTCCTCLLYRSLL